MKKVLIALVFLAFVPEKKYSVTLSLEQWQQSIDIIETAKSAIKASDIQIKYASPLMDSLTKIQNQFIGQLKPQIDTTK